MNDNTNITVADIILPREHFVRMERQLAAAERLYDAALRLPISPADALDLVQAMTDYANAKGEK